MSEEFGFNLSDVNISNIKNLHIKQSKLEELRIIEIYELVCEIVKASLDLYRDGMAIPEILTLLSEELRGSLGAPHENALDINAERLLSFVNSQSALDKALLSELYLEELKRHNISLSERDFLPENDSPETFVYVKNSLADEAYDVFAESFRDPRVKYASTLKEAVRLVTDGEVTYCLLPLEEAGGERLHAASELIFKNDLKINSVTPVFGLDGNADMKYSLISRRFMIPKIEEDDDLYLELRVSTARSLSLFDLLLAAEHYGARVYRINSTVFSTEDGGEAYYSLVFRSDKGDFLGLLTYLTLFAGNYTPVGIYKNLE